jgi:hypothetical protein
MGRAVKVKTKSGLNSAIRLGILSHGVSYNTNWSGQVARSLLCQRTTPAMPAQNAGVSRRTTARGKHIVPEASAVTKDTHLVGAINIRNRELLWIEGRDSVDAQGARRARPDSLWRYFACSCPPNNPPKLLRR